MNFRRITQEDFESWIVSEKFFHIGKKTTICLLTLVDGYEVIGESHCLDPAAYDFKMGSEIARMDAGGKVWDFIQHYEVAKSIHEGLYNEI